MSILIRYKRHDPQRAELRSARMVFAPNALYAVPLADDPSRHTAYDDVILPGGLSELGYLVLREGAPFADDVVQAVKDHEGHALNSRGEPRYSQAWLDSLANRYVCVILYSAGGERHRGPGHPGGS